MAATINEIYEQVVDNYLSLLDMKNVPAPHDIERDLLKLINSEIKLYNTGRDKDERLAYAKVLPARVIAEVIMKVYSVRRIIWSSDIKSGDIFIYQTDGPGKGTYTNDETVFHRIIRLFDYASKPKTVDDVMSILIDHAQITTVNADPDLVPVNNGVFDYQKKILMDFSPDMVFLSKSKVDYNPSAANVVIHNDEDNTDWDVETWVHELSDDDAITELLWQVIGAAIRPYVRWDKIICFYSTIGCNGKGTLCRLIRNLCTKTANIPFSAFGDEFMLEQLMDASAIITDENVTRSYIRCTDRIKAVATQDNISINRKYKKPITIKFSGLMIQCINDMPKFGDKTESLYRRLLMIPFSKTFVDCDRTYIKTDYLNRAEVLEYVLYKVLNTDYYNFSEPTACSDLLFEYKEFNDPVRSFISEVMSECVWDLLPYGFLYDLYKGWFRDNCPTGQLQSKRMFINDLKTALVNNNEYIVYDKPVSTRNLMDGTERLILRYDLTDWKSSYKGSDEVKICDFSRKDSYRGVLRAK